MARFASLFLAACLAAAPAAAFPSLEGNVVDAAGLLTPEEESRLAARLARHGGATGRRIVVATVPSLDGWSVELYAAQLAGHWNIESWPGDAGAILLVADAERRVRFEFGPPVRGTMTDVRSSGVVQRVVLPAFRAGQFAIGIEAGLDELALMLDEGVAQATAGPPGVIDILMDKRVLVPAGLLLLALGYCVLRDGACRHERV
ncbi:MAG: TPM domain-containing protein [Alphaproteobacteria bacterium]|nr:TPM domain-containing protein [Alphaproteobacteria bacterium]